MKYGCIGASLPHSFSREIHEKIGGYAYELRELTEAELPDFLTKDDFCAINVTIPYKQAVIPYLAHVSERARAIGAVNTIVRREDGLWGYNTDFGGMTAQMERMGLDPKGKKVLVLGTGGTSRTACAAAHALGAASVRRVSRTAREGSLTYEEALRDHADAEILVNTTPVGMFPSPEGIPVSPDAFPRLTDVLDAVYNPLSTRLVLEARRLGIRAEGGLYMLTAQAVLAAEIFTGRTLGKEATERIFAEVLTEKENIVLIGMPGSGKTTVGKLLAARLSRPHVDTDGEIAAAAGTTIPEIFARQGEEAFRDRESEVIRRLAVRGGCVISTGGGAILRPENVAALRQNGKLFWLDRPQEQLVPTADRPLADSEEKLRRLAAVREPLYRAAADVTVDAGVSPEEAADTIIKELP